jgi:hypothetical protein
MNSSSAKNEFYRFWYHWSKASGMIIPLRKGATRDHWLVHHKVQYRKRGENRDLTAGLVLGNLIDQLLEHLVPHAFDELDTPYHEVTTPADTPTRELVP